jgi:hypothetical protein
MLLIPTPPRARVVSHSCVREYPVREYPVREFPIRKYAIIEGGRDSVRIVVYIKF